MVWRKQRPPVCSWCGSLAGTLVCADSEKWFPARVQENHSWGFFVGMSRQLQLAQLFPGDRSLGCNLQNEKERTLEASH